MELEKLVMDAMEFVHSTTLPVAFNLQYSTSNFLTSVFKMLKGFFTQSQFKKT